MHYQCSLAAAAGSRCTGARSGVVTERGSRGIGAAQKVTGPSMGVKHKEDVLPGAVGQDATVRPAVVVGAEHHQVSV